MAASSKAYEFHLFLGVGSYFFLSLSHQGVRKEIQNYPTCDKILGRNWKYMQMTYMAQKMISIFDEAKNIVGKWENISY